MLRVVGRREGRAPDVVVERSSPDPVTVRAIPKPRSAPAEPQGSPELALERLEDEAATVHTSELLLEPFDTESETTPVASWQRLIPPPLPEKS